MTSTQTSVRSVGEAPESVVAKRPSTDRLVLAAILVLAAVLRLVNLPGRGEWDQDQGQQMLALLSWVRDGQVPLLGPATIGTHHPAGFYYLLAPSAFLTDANPVAAVVTLAVIGVGGVAATWWLARTIGGALAGHVAGLLMAVSPAAITASTFVWNPNIVAPGAALAAAAAWQAWRTERPRWYLLAGVGTLVMLQGHLLAIVALPVLASIVAMDVARRSGSRRRELRGPVVGAVLIALSGYLPLLIFELSHGFAEIRGATSMAGGADARMDMPVPARIGMLLWRALAYPVSGPAPDAVMYGVFAVLIALAAIVVAIRSTRDVERRFGWWSAGAVVWTAVALSMLAPFSALVVAGTPNDHYHAWLDPIVCAAIGVGVARLWHARWKAAAAGVLVVSLALALTAMPPLTSPDGGWPKAVETAERIRATTEDHTVAVAGLGIPNGAKAVEFTLRRGGAPVTEPATADYLLIVVDPAWHPELGGCSEAVATHARWIGRSVPRVVDRIDVASFGSICVFSSA